jgi:hypothetical protein
MSQRRRKLSGVISSLLIFLAVAAGFAQGEKARRKNEANPI